MREMSNKVAIRSSKFSQCWYFGLESSSLFHHSVIVDLSVYMMMHLRS